MAPNDIREKLDRSPFQPLCIHVTDGAFYIVYRSSDASVSRMEMFIGIEPDEHGLPSRAIYIDPRHVTRIEPLSNGPAESNGTRE